MSKPTILHICLSKGWGGLEMYPIRIGRELLQRNYQVLGLCNQGTQVESGMKQAGLTLFSATSKPSLLTLQLPRLLQWLKQHNVRIIHCHKSGDLLVAALIKQFIPAKVIFTEHMGVKRPKKDIYHRWIYSHVDQVLSISDETYQRNIHALPVDSNRITRLWLGTTIPQLSKLDSEERSHLLSELSLNPDSYIIGTIGRISPGKGQIELIKAFALITQNIPNARLLIVGGTEEAQGCDLAYLTEIEQLIDSLKLRNEIIFSGFRRDIDSLFALMDVVCLPYRNEAFGLTAIEAMAAQRPIIAANTGALPEILAESAVYCDPEDEHSIATAILQRYHNPEQAQLDSIQARERACKEFSIEVHMQKLLTFYLN